MRKSSPWQLIVLAIGVALVTIMASRRSRANDNSRTPIRSIAVLPLRNLTGNAANDYLSDGLTESLITTLSKEARSDRHLTRLGVFTERQRPGSAGSRAAVEGCGFVGRQPASEW